MSPSTCWFSDRGPRRSEGSVLSGVNNRGEVRRTSPVGGVSGTVYISTGGPPSAGTTLGKAGGGVIRGPN